MNKTLILSFVSIGMAFFMIYISILAFPSFETVFGIIGMVAFMMAGMGLFALGYGMEEEKNAIS